MAHTRSATRASKASISRHSTSGVTKSRSKKATTGKTPLGSAPRLHFHQVQIESLEAEDNILRLCFRKEYATGIFAGLHDDAEDICIGTNVKLGVCFLLSTSLPNTFKRGGALPKALDGLCTCLNDTFKKRARPVTKAHKKFTSQLRRQLHRVVELPNFLTLSSDILYEKFADIFVPENSLTGKEVVDYFRPSFWRPNRMAAYEHLYNSYGNESGHQALSDDAGRLITEWLAFPLGNRAGTASGWPFAVDESSMTGSNVSGALCTESGCSQESS